MKVQSLALALNKLSKTSHLGKMVTASAVQVKQKQHTQKINIDSKKSIYEKNVKDTFKNGISTLYPCSLLTWKPGTPMKTCGGTGRIKWGLSDGNLEFAVVAFDAPQVLASACFTSEVGIVPVAYLNSCDCAGYTHEKHCSPQVNT